MDKMNTNNKEPVLRLSDITMQFGGVVAVNNLSLDVEEGKIVALIGPNGAGKTTAFNVITGVYAPTNGKVEFMGKTIVSNYPQGKMKKEYAGQNNGKYKGLIRKTPDKITKFGIGRTFQNIRLFRELSVFENVLIAKHMNMKSGIVAATCMLNYKEDKAMREESLKLLEIVGLEDCKNEISGSLPYGQQRRLEIARALATEPKLLLLDEPAAGMNPQETNDLASFIHDLRKDFDLSILMIEHHMNLVMEISEKIYVLDFGKLIAQGNPSEIQTDQRVIDAYLGVADHE